jgi:hypothetical protein
MDPDNNIIKDYTQPEVVWGELLVSNLWLCVILDDIIVWIHVWGELLVSNLWLCVILDDVIVWIHVRQ